jgi:hypothetical protein
MADKELDDLLDSALDDFDKKLTIENEKELNARIIPVSSGASNITIEKTELYVDDIDYDDRPRGSAGSKAQSNVTAAANAADAGSTMPGFNLSEDEMKLFDEIFNDAKTKDTMKQFTEALSGFKEGDEKKLLENFGKVMSQLTSEDLGDDDDDDDEDLDENFAKNLEGLDFFKNLNQKPSSSSVGGSKAAAASGVTEKKTEAGAPTSPFAKVLEDMNKNSEKVLNNSNTNNESFPFSSDFFANFASSLAEGSKGAAGGGEDNEADNAEGAASSLMMEPILSMLFSKDILYPSLNLMLENYDKYIEERKDKLSEDELKKCHEQKACIKDMCQVYEQSKETDSQEAKSQQLKKILELLERCGVGVIVDFNIISAFFRPNKPVVNVSSLILDATN